VHASRELDVVNASARHATRRDDALATATLAPAVPEQFHIGPGHLFGYISGRAIGLDPLPIADENHLATVHIAYQFGGPRDALSISPRGYVLLGASQSDADAGAEPQYLPDPAQPNGLLAPFWSDLSFEGAPGVFGSIVANSSGMRWIVVEWRMRHAATGEPVAFELWIGLNGVDDVTFAYAPRFGIAPGLDETVGVENSDGSQGEMITGLPSTDLRATATAAQPGGTFDFDTAFRGAHEGTATVTASAAIAQSAWVSTATSSIGVVRRSSRVTRTVWNAARSSPTHLGA
jgi:hypothetical protein